MKNKMLNRVRDFISKDKVELINLIEDALHISIDPELSTIYDPVSGQHLKISFEDIVTTTRDVIIAAIVTFDKENI